MSKKETDIFDRLDNVIGNYMEGKASLFDISKIAMEVNQYLLKHPHPHDIIDNERDIIKTPPSIH